MRILNILLLFLVVYAVNAADTLDFKTSKERSTVFLIKALNSVDGSDEQIELLLKSVAMDSDNRLALKQFLQRMKSPKLTAKFAPQLLEIAKESNDLMQNFVYNTLQGDEDVIFKLNCDLIDNTPLNSLNSTHDEAIFLGLLTTTFRYAVTHDKQIDLAPIYKKMLSSKDLEKSLLANRVRFYAVELFSELGEEYKSAIDENSELLMSDDLPNSDIGIIYAHAKLFFKIKRYDLAAKATELILKREPKNMAATILRFYSFFDDGKFVEAEKSLDFLNKDTWIYSQFRMLILLQQKEYDKCVALFREQEQKFPKEIGADDYLRLMIVCEKSRNIELFEYCWQKLEALNMLYGDENIANNVGYVAASLGVRLDEAEKLLKFSLSKAPESAIYLDSMAWVLYRQGRYKEAKVYIEKALKSSGLEEKGELYGHAGDIALKLGDIDEAIVYFQKALELDDEDLDRELIEKKLKKIDI